MPVKAISSRPSVQSSRSEEDAQGDLSPVPPSKDSTLATHPSRAESAEHLQITDERAYCNTYQDHSTSENHSQPLATSSMDNKRTGYY